MVADPDSRAGRLVDGSFPKLKLQVRPDRQLGRLAET